MLSETLETGERLASKLLRRMAREGLVSSAPICIRGLTVKVNSKAKKSVQEVEAAVLQNSGDKSAPCCENCRARALRLTLRKKNLCVQCAREIFGQRWCRAITTLSVDRRKAVMEELYQEALPLVLKKEIISVAQIQRWLLIGRDTAQRIMDRFEAEDIVDSSSARMIMGREVFVVDNAMADDGTQCSAITTKTQPSERTSTLASTTEMFDEDPLYQIALMLVTEKQMTGINFLHRELGITNRRAWQMQQRLENEGIIRRRGNQADVLVNSPLTLSPMGINRRISELQRLCRLLGKGKTSELLETVIHDLKELRKLRSD
jgi:DNA segregation ATPase FtsK/SpoIIIE-like protein